MQNSETTASFLESSEADVMGYLTVVLFDNTTRFKIAFKSTTTSLVRAPARPDRKLPIAATAPHAAGGWACTCTRASAVRAACRTS